MAGRLMPPLHIVAVMPPPLNGMTHVTQQMISAFSSAGSVRVSMVSNDAGYERPRWVLKRHAAFIAALIRNAVVSRRRGACYFVPNSDVGLWLNLLEAPLLRLGYSEVWLHHHVFRYARQRDPRMRAFLWLLGGNARHIALSETMAARLRALYGAETVHVLGNAAFVPDVPAGPEKAALRTCGFLGNITREKGIGLFMETLRALEARGRRLEAVIAGPVEDAALKAEIDAFVAEAPERRVALGAVRGDAKRAFLERIDLLLFPSRYENEALPVTIYEALAAGAPVLATRRGCIPDQLEGLDWTLPEEGFAAEAGARIEAWIDDPDAFAAAARAARARFDAQRRLDAESLDALTLATRAR